MFLKVYADLLSQQSRALIIFLNKNEIPFEDIPLNLAKAEHHSEEFAKINPFHAVPVIQDGDFTLRETVGILRYLCRENKVADHWYPKDSKQQAHVDEYLEWQHNESRLRCAMYFQLKWLHPVMTGMEKTSEKVNEYENRMLKCLDHINNIWLKNDPYLAGNQISIADILAACEVEQPRISGYDPCQGRPALDAWLTRVQKDLSPHYERAHWRLRLVEKFKRPPFVKKF